MFKQEEMRMRLKSKNEYEQREMIRTRASIDRLK